LLGCSWSRLCRMPDLEMLLVCSQYTSPHFFRIIVSTLYMYQSQVRTVHVDMCWLQGRSILADTFRLSTTSGQAQAYPSLFCAVRWVRKGPWLSQDQASLQTERLKTVKLENIWTIVPQINQAAQVLHQLWTAPHGGLGLGAPDAVTSGLLDDRG
jgi:hypothetical protein